MPQLKTKFLVSAGNSFWTPGLRDPRNTGTCTHVLKLITTIIVENVSEPGILLGAAIISVLHVNSAPNDLF